ncbi:MAG: hypothetical protein FH751_10035 [Firmicutes bacterium]|nr:hypothetical protein [Bacillota bacterium]
MLLNLKQKKNLIIILLSLLLLLNLFFIITYSKHNSNLKKGIIINEFSRITKDWRNFNFFLKEIDEYTLNNLNKQNISLFMNLSNPSKSSIPNTSNMLTSEYNYFLSEFDRLYANIVKVSINKLPKMSQNELLDLQKDMIKAYNIFSSIQWKITNANKKNFTIILNFDKSKLREVIKILTKVENKLYKIN